MHLKLFLWSAKSLFSLKSARIDLICFQCGPPKRVAHPWVRGRGECPENQLREQKKVLLLLTHFIRERCTKAKNCHDPEGKKRAFEIKI